MNDKAPEEVENRIRNVPNDFIRIYGINDSIFQNNFHKSIFIRSNFDALSVIKRIFPWKCFYAKLNDCPKTRGILYQIADSITGNTQNPRKIYGTRIREVLEELEKVTSQQQIVIFANKIDPEIIPKISNLDLKLRIIAQPVRGWEKISKYNKNGLCQIITLDSSAQMQESLLRSFIKRKSTKKVYNPWGNITPQALVQVLSESDENLLLFIRMIQQTLKHEMISTKNVKKIIDKAWEVHLKKDILISEWYILRNLFLYPLKNDLKQICNKIPKTKFEHLFRSLYKRKLIIKERSYDENGKKYFRYYVRPVVAEFMEVIS